MGRTNAELYAFNRGVVSPLALARVDIKRVALSAEEQVNWVPRVLGSMSLRPGLQYLGSSYTNSLAKYIPFVFSTTDTALVELTANVLRIWKNDSLITRPSVSTAVTNGTFGTDLTGWTDADEASATSTWATGGYMSLLGNGTNSAIRTQTLAVAGGDQNVVHALRIVVTQGFLTLRVGSSAGGGEYVAETSLAVGTHSIAFTPTGANVYLQLSNRNSYATLVDSVAIESAGVLTLPTSWGSGDIRNARFDQSGDVIFVACSGVGPKRIERRNNDSWSVVNYVSDSGPFRTINTSTVTITPDALSGAVTLTASKPTFRTTNVDSLYSVQSVGQTVSSDFAASDVYTDPIRVTGIGSGRSFGITITGTWVATIYLQQATDSAGPWTDVTSYTTNQSTSYDDTLNNQIIYYRLGIKPAGYTSGTATAKLTYAAGTINGIVRVTTYISSTQVSGVVVKNLGATTASSDWAEGAWSQRRGYPSSVALNDGRLWWAGKDRIVGSVSDDYSNFDPDYVGDAGPILRSIGSGPVDEINWLVSANNLVVGTQGAEKVVRSSALGEPVTPTNFNMKDASTFGSADVNAIKVDKNVIFADRSNSRIMDAAYDAGTTEYVVTELTAAAPEICRPGVVVAGSQRRPDTRVHFVLSNGTVAMVVYDKAEDVKCWIKIETNGVIEDVVTLPGTEEDQVYYSVQRTINGSTVRYLEKWAKESECVGGTTNKQADAFIQWTGASSTTITGLTHLIGASVVVWANGKDLGTYTVSGGGTITISEATTSAIVGLTYQARFKSSKLAYAAQNGTALTQRKRVDHIGLILANTHYQGLQYGPDYTTLDTLPLVENGADTAADTVWASYDEDGVEFPGSVDNDSRVCLVANAPRPCTVLAAVLSMTTHEKL